MVVDQETCHGLGQPLHVEERLLKMFLTHIKSEVHMHRVPYAMVLTRQCKYKFAIC